jgi:hypothetical protein
MLTALISGNPGSFVEQAFQPATPTFLSALWPPLRPLTPTGSAGGLAAGVLCALDHRHSSAHANRRQRPSALQIKQQEIGL